MPIMPPHVVCPGPPVKVGAKEESPAAWPLRRQVRQLKKQHCGSFFLLGGLIDALHSMNKLVAGDTTSDKVSVPLFWGARKRPRM